MKGEQLSRVAGRLCQNPDFWALCMVDDAGQAAEFVRAFCGVASRADLDHDPAAAERFHVLRRRFAYGDEA